MTDRASLRKRLKIEGLRFSGRAARKPGWKTKQDFLCSAHSAYAIQTFKNVGAQAVSLSLDGTNNQIALQGALFIREPLSSRALFAPLTC